MPNVSRSAKIALLFTKRFRKFIALTPILIAVMTATGVFLSAHYIASTKLAFDSVERLTREVWGGHAFRALHAHGASMLFIMAYYYIFRGIYEGAYKSNRRQWLCSIVLFLLTMVAAFSGYVLPWGQMSYWGATVALHMLSAVPIMGRLIAEKVFGDFSVDSPTILQRFFVLHILFAVVSFGFAIWTGKASCAEKRGESGPGPKNKRRPFVLWCLLIFYVALALLFPQALENPDNLIPADAMKTPMHLRPEWYFLPFFAILRAVTVDIHIPFSHVILISSTLGGVILVFGSVAVWFALPWFDQSPMRRTFGHTFFFAMLVLAGVTLGYVGYEPAEEPFTTIGQCATCYYFCYFLVALPALEKLGRF